MVCFYRLTKLYRIDYDVLYKMLSPIDNVDAKCLRNTNFEVFGNNI